MLSQARDHCDTNGLTSFDNWYRIGVHEKKMPDACVAPNKCGADNGYYVGGNMGHPDPGLLFLNITAICWHFWYNYMFIQTKL